MYNYEHEIACPDNKGIQNYLWYDHFHDSKINNISFDHIKGLVSLTIECCSNIEEIRNKLKGSQDARKKYLDEHKDNFTYILTFKGTKYFHTERLIMINDYINGRFKDTALLRKFIVENKKQLYHFRIQVDDGYIDVIFSDFIIRKKTGRVKYHVQKLAYQTYSSHTDDDKKAALDGDDFERFLAMQKLYKTNAPELLDIARNNLKLEGESEDSCLYSAYLLGKLGDSSDVPKLLKIHLDIEEHFLEKSICRCSAILPKRNILDAIELIKYRITV